MIKYTVKIGDVYGQLIVVEDLGKCYNDKFQYFQCRCDCGTLIILRKDRLYSGETQSCGCINKQQTRERLKQDLIGKKWDRLEVIEDLGYRNHQNIWLCKCTCGRTKELITSEVNRKRFTSCGQCKYDLTNRRFGLLLVVSKNISSQNGQQLWNCECDCGNTTVVATNKLNYGWTKSCGCLIKRTGAKNPQWEGIGEISKRLFTSYAFGAKRRNLAFNLSLEEIWNLYLQQNKKCKISGLPLSFNRSAYDTDGTASLDRINPDLGYTLDNVQWIHKDINKMKMNFEETYFIDMCKIISDYNT